MIYEDALMQDYKGSKEIVLDHLLIIQSFVQRLDTSGCIHLCFHLKITDKNRHSFQAAGRLN